MGSRGRCEAHGLATGPDGACVLCRRKPVEPRPGATPARSLPRLALALCALGSVATLGWMLLPTAPRVSAAPPTQAEPPLGQPMTAPPRSIESTIALELSPSPALPPSTESAQQRDPSVRHEEHARAELERAREEAARDAQRRAQREADEQAQRLGQARRRVSVTLYATGWCGHCKRARRYLQNEGIAFEEHDIESDSAARARAQRLNPRGSVPTFDIDGQVMIGFSEQRFEYQLALAARKRLERE